MVNVLYACLVAFFISLSGSAFADTEAGKLKTLKGQANIQRQGSTIPATIGMSIYATDTLITGKDGSAGITLNDGTRLTAGPNSTLALNAYQFNPTTHAGQIDATLKSGVLAVVSGKISKANPDQVKYRTQHSIVGVRGTEFIIDASL